MKDKTFLAVNKEYWNLGLKSLDLLLIAQIEEFQRNDHVCYMTNKQFSAAFGESESTVKRRLEKLEELHVIRRQTSFISGNGKGTRQRTLKVNDRSKWKVQIEGDLLLEGSDFEFDKINNEECKVQDEPIKYKEKYNIKDKYDLDVIEEVIRLYKRKTKYKEIQANILERYQLEILFDDIGEIVRNKEEYMAYVEKEKLEANRKEKELRYMSYQYDKIPKVIDVLKNKGVFAEYDDVKKAYDENVKSNTAVKWDIAELDSAHYLSLIKEGMLFSDYVEAVFQFKQDIEFGHISW